MLKDELQSLKDLSLQASPAPWENHLEEDPSDNEVTTTDGSLVAFVQPHGNINTVIKYGEQFSHADVKLIVDMRNKIDGLINGFIAYHDEAMLWRQLLAEFLKLNPDECRPEMVREHLTDVMSQLNNIDRILKGMTHFENV